MTSEISARSERVLVHAPFGRDAALIASALRHASLAADVCPSLPELCSELERGVGCVLIADEALDSGNVANLGGALLSQPQWSDTPVLIMTNGGKLPAGVTSAYSFGALGNITLLERPLRPVTLLSAVQTALRARRRQYQIAEHLRERDLAGLALQRYRDIFEHTEHGLLISSTATQEPQLLNPAFARIHGMDRSELARASLLDLTAPDARPALMEALQTSEVKGQVSVESRHLRRDGTEFPVMLGITAVRSDEGKILYTIINVEDISDRRQAESERERLSEQVRESERLYRVIGESIDFGIWVCDDSGRNIYASDSFLKLVGMNQQQCSDSGWTDVLHPDDAESTISAWKECVEKAGVWDMVHRYRGLDGKWHLILARGLPIRNETGEVVMWAGINLDISPQKRAELALQETNAALRRSNADLEQFAYAASHDLQEPLRTVSIYSQLLKQRYSGAFDSHGEQFIDYIVSGSKRMEMLIKDLLAYTQSGALSTEPSQPADAASVLSAALANLSATVVETQALITHDELPQVAVQEIHLQQVFQNLIGNALKYRGPQPPVIHISAEPHEDRWLFAVKDNGIGIEPQYSELVFVLFKRLHGSQKYQGTGIGLAMCQKIVERYGGRIWVESELGAGSTFRFTLPAAH
ncbi:MAG: PAS domain S-box protein [Bryobacteraceae bacterium]